MLLLLWSILRIFPVLGEIMEEDGGSGVSTSSAIKEQEPKEAPKVSYSDLLKLNKNLISIKDFVGKKIKEVRFIPGFEFFGSNRDDKEVSFVLTFEDGSISMPLGNLENQPFTECTYDGFIEVGLLTEEHKQKAIARNKEFFRLNKKIQNLENRRKELQEKLLEYGLSWRQTRNIGRKIKSVEKTIEETKNVREKLIQSFP